MANNNGIITRPGIGLKYQYLLDPIGFFSRNSGININITKEDGTRNTELEEQLRSDSLTYDFLERDYRR